MPGRLPGVRAAFAPSAALPRPHGLVTASVMVAPTTDEALVQAAPMRHAFRQLRSTGALDPLLTPAQAVELAPADAGVGAPDAPSGVQFAGTAEEVLTGLASLAERTGAQEVMVTTVAHDSEVSVRSLRLLAAAARTAGRRSAPLVPA